MRRHSRAREVSEPIRRVRPQKGAPHGVPGVVHRRDCGRHLQSGHQVRLRDVPQVGLWWLTHGTLFVGLLLVLLLAALCWPVEQLAKKVAGVVT